MAKGKPDSEQLFSSVSNLFRLVRHELYRAGCFSDASGSEVEILKFIQQENSATMKSIAEHLYVKPSSATSSVEALVKRGALKRVLDPEDRRIIRIVLTSKGKKSIDAKHAMVKKNLAPIFKGLSEKEKKTLVTIIDTVIKQNNYDNA